MEPEPLEEVAEGSVGPSLLRSTVVMSVGTALSRVTGFLRLMATAWALGVTESRLADTYAIANTTPNIIYELALGGILSSIFVPVFVAWMRTKGREAAWDLARRFFTVALVGLGGLTVVAIVFAPQIMRLYASGVTDRAAHAYVVALGTFLLRFFLPQIVFYGIGAVATGLLNAHRRFAAPMFAPILNNVVVIATMVVYGVMAASYRGDATYVPGLAEQLVLAIGTTLGVVAMTLALWPSVRRLGFRFHWRVPRGEGVRRVLHLAKWVVVYVVANQIGFLIVLILAAPTQGGPAAYGMAFIMFQLPHAIFAVSVFTALLPGLSARWADGDTAGFRSLLGEGIGLTGFILLPAAAGYVALAEPIVRLLFEHGATTSASVGLVTDVLRAMALGLFSFSFFQLMLRAFYATQDSRTPALVNIGAVALNTAVNVALVRVLGVQGLALGLAVAYSVGGVVLALFLRAKLGGIGGPAVAIAVLKEVVLALATGVTAFGAFRELSGVTDGATLPEQALLVAAPIAAGAGVYFAGARLLRVRELQLLWRAISGRLRSGELEG